MNVNYLSRMSLTCRAFFALGLLNLSACIPIPLAFHGAFEESLEEVDIGSTHREEIHGVFGTPRIADEEWGVEVYTGKMDVTIANIPPFAVDIKPIQNSPTSYSVMFIYEEDGTVRAFDTAIGTINLEGFRLYQYGYREHDKLLAPSTYQEIERQITISSEECLLYLLSDLRVSMTLSGRHITSGISKGFFQFRLATGIHSVSFKSRVSEENGKIKLLCENGNTLYIQISRQYITQRQLDNGDHGYGYKIELFTKPPEELLDRYLIIYPSIHETIQPDETPETIANNICPKADLGNSDAQKQLGDIYYYGLQPQLRPDLIQAYVWYGLATKTGNIEAALELPKVVNGMLSEQLEKAEQMLIDWMPGQCANDFRNAMANYFI